MPKYILKPDTLKPLWDRGDTTSQIAAQLGVTKSAISQAARRFGFPPRSPGRTRMETVWRRRAEADTLREEGLSLAEIAVMQGISLNLAKQDAFQFRWAA